MVYKFNAAKLITLLINNDEKNQFLLDFNSDYIFFNFKIEQYNYLLHIYLSTLHFYQKP